MFKKLFLIVFLTILIVNMFSPAAIASGETRTVFANVAEEIDFSVYFPTFIPEGFDYDPAKSQILEDEYRIYFTGEKGEISINSVGSGDIGATENTKILSVGGLEVSIGEQGESTTVAWWEADGRSYAIFAQGVDLDEMELIANSIILSTGNLPYTGIDSRWFALAFTLIAVGAVLIVFNPRSKATDNR